jgi:hypothetical protein
VGDGSAVLHFAVRFYTLNPEQLKDEAARYYFFAQVRQDIKHSRCPIPCHALSVICAYAVQGLFKIRILIDSVSYFST